MKRLAVLASADPPEPAGPGDFMQEGVLALTFLGLVSIPRRRRPHARGDARMRPGSRVPWTGGSARLYLARGRTPSQDAGARRCTCSPAVKAAGRVPFPRRMQQCGLARRCDRRGVGGVAPPVAQDCCQLPRTDCTTDRSCLPFCPLHAARCTLSRPRLPLTRVAAMDLNNSYGSARSADMQYGGLNTRFCGCIAKLRLSLTLRPPS